MVLKIWVNFIEEDVSDGRCSKVSPSLTLNKNEDFCNLEELMSTILGSRWYTHTHTRVYTHTFGIADRL